MRGKEVQSVDPKIFQDVKLYTSWISPEIAFNVATQPRTFNGYEKCAALISNSSSAVKPLNEILTKAWDMFTVRAYVHQYVQRGLSEEDFLDAFVSLEQVVSTYKMLWFIFIQVN